MGDLDRRSRKLVHGWPSGGLVVGLLPDSSHREWSGKAALELATAAAHDRLAALVLDLAPDDTDLASRFGADPEPGFAQVMTGEVELSEIQHWDAARGAYYLPGGVRVLSDKVAKSRSVEALAKRVRGQEGILFVLLDRHAAEAAAQTGWLDGVVRLGQADLGGPKMFGQVTALGLLERRETTTRKPWEREGREPAATGPSAGPAGEPSDAGAAEGTDEADRTVEPEVPAESADAGPEVTDGQPALEVSEEAWEPDVAARTEVLDRPDRATAGGDVEDTDDPSVVDITDAADADDGEEDREASSTEPPVLEVPDALWEPREVEEPGITDEPEIATETHEVETGNETPASAETVEAGDPEAPEASQEPSEPELAGAAEVEAEGGPAGLEVVPEEDPREEVLGAESAGQSEVMESPEERPEGETADEETPLPEIVAEHPDDTAAAEEPDEPEVGEEAELQPEEEPGEPEVAETADESTGTETADGAEVETDDAPAGPEIAEEEQPEEEIPGPEVGTEPEITEEPGEPEITPAEEPAEAEVADDSELTESPEETAEEELDTPAGLERFAEIPDEDEAPETGEAPAATAAEDVAEEGEAEAAAETDGDDDGEPGEPVPEPRADEREQEDGEPVHAEVITSGLDVWPEEAEESVASGEGVGPEPADAPAETEEPAASVISAALWASPEENGEPREAEEPERTEFISPAMWFSKPDDAGAEVSTGDEFRSAEVISRGKWASTGRTAEVTDPPVESDEVQDDEEAAATGEPEEADGHQREESTEPQRADFILDGLELPPEWSEEWEEEERRAAEADEELEADEESEADEHGSAGESEEDGKADFVTQGLGIPDDEESDDPWPDSTASSGWRRDSGSTSGTWERDPYGSSAGRAASTTADRPERRGLALSRRGEEGAEIWKKARTAAIVFLTVGSVGVFGSAVVDSGALSAVGDVAATAVGGFGGGTSGGDGGSGGVATAGAAAASGAAVAPADSAGSTSEERGRDESYGAAPPLTSGDGGEATSVSVSRAPRFDAVTDSVRRSIEEYDAQMDLYREGQIGCARLMSAREEAGRLFVRLSMFRLSEGTQPDSLVQTAYRRWGRDMERVEESYAETGCRMPSAPAPADEAADTTTSVPRSDTAAPAASAADSADEWQETDTTSTGL